MGGQQRHYLTSKRPMASQVRQFPRVCQRQELATTPLCRSKIFDYWDENGFDLDEMQEKEEPSVELFEAPCF